MRSSSAAHVVAHGLVRRFGDLTAVDGIDLDVGEGEIFGFLGPNGAGKSTTVRMLVTLLKPSAGSASVAGFDVASQPNEVRRRIGVITFVAPYVGSKCAVLSISAFDDMSTDASTIVRGVFVGLKAGLSGVLERDHLLTTIVIRVPAQSEDTRWITHSRIRGR